MRSKKESRIKQCRNCGIDTFNRYCSRSCYREWHNTANARGQMINVLSLLDERGGWVSLPASTTIDSLAYRITPLITVRNSNRFTVEAHILPKGEQWLAYHQEKAA